MHDIMLLATQKKSQRKGLQCVLVKQNDGLITEIPIGPISKGKKKIRKEKDYDFQGATCTEKVLQLGGFIFGNNNALAIVSRGRRHEEVQEKRRE